MQRILPLLAILTCAPGVLADDVTLKNGKVYKDLTLVRETATTYTFLTHEGNRVTLSKSMVVSIDKKPTVRGEFMQREEALDMRDLDAVCELAAWADEKGMSKDARELFKKVLLKDKDNAKAHEGLGDKLWEGKWISQSEYERRMEQQNEKKYKALGWQKLGNAWLSPVDYYRKKNDLVEHQGHWVTQHEKKRIEKEQLVWMEGDWVTPEEKQKMDAGQRPYKGGWKSIDELDDIHKSLEDPWTLQGRWIEVQGNARHRDLVQVLEWAEGAYLTLKDLFGEHPDLYDDKTGRLVLVVGSGVNTYQELGKTYTRDDRIAYKSSGYGAFYAPTWGRGRGAGCTYIHGDENWVRIWTDNAVTHAFIARLVDYLKTDEKAVEALSGWVMGCGAGKPSPGAGASGGPSEATGADGQGVVYDPTVWFFWRFFDQPLDRPIGSASGMFDRVDYRNEAAIPHAGLLLEFLRQKDAKAFRAFWQEFVVEGGGLKLDRLLQDCYGQGGQVDAEALDKEFAEWTKAFHDRFKKEKGLR